MEYFVVDNQVYLRLPIGILDGLASMTTFLRFPRRIKTYHKIFDMLEDVKFKRKSPSVLRMCFYGCYSLYLLATYKMFLTFKENTFHLDEIILVWNAMLDEIKEGKFPEYRKAVYAKYCVYGKAEEQNAIIITAGFSLVLKTMNSRTANKDDIADFGILL